MTICDDYFNGTLKCWDEKNEKGIPPIIVVDEITKMKSYSDNKSDNKYDNNYNLKTKNN